MYNIYPKVKEQLHNDGYFTLKEVNLFCEKNKNVFIDLQKILKVNEVSLEKDNNIKWLLSDFKKEDGYKKSIELSKKYDLYRQDYCGCVYSLKELSEKTNNK